MPGALYSPWKHIVLVILTLNMCPCVLTLSSLYLSSLPTGPVPAVVQRLSTANSAWLHSVRMRDDDDLRVTGKTDTLDWIAGHRDWGWGGGGLLSDWSFCTQWLPIWTSFIAIVLDLVGLSHVRSYSGHACLMMRIDSGRARCWCLTSWPLRVYMFVYVCVCCYMCVRVPMCVVCCPCMCVALMQDTGDGICSMIFRL